ncbi:fusaric acid resistance protein [Nitrospirillum viridazoti Y2]|uniref:Multidrug resistance protein MdtO n=1 Tax=Nitrospirillum amazonense TaxID=28077 RepID=A0A560HRB7_9PROT|nr:FUSC family protein [Nitrospirillum amazonense]EGY02678.1 fusaric acid resistance protein [Nitrospirillum amazonense Y2]TWB48935.1 multidrug resistance protein MdtO [Nitrospirillum amazonense]
MAVADGPPLLALLRAELAPRPGRISQVCRIAITCTVVVIIGQIFQVPLTPYMAYAVFLVSGGEAASTVMVGLVAALAFTIAVGLSLLFYVFDASEPALRIPLMALSTFAGMYLVRVMTLGPVMFLASFVLVLSQTLIDEIPNLEALTHTVLWLWVVVMIPVVATILVNLLIGEDPARLARRTAHDLLKALADALRSGDFSDLAERRQEAVTLMEVRHKAAFLNPGLHGRDALDSMLIETVAELLALCPLLPPQTPAAIRLPLAAVAEDCATFLSGGAPPKPLALAMPTPDLTPEATAVVIAFRTAMMRLRDGLSQRDSVNVSVLRQRKPLFVSDAFTNPSHARFALKTTLAAMACYVAYNLVDWPGIDTAITTCFFVALGSLGETMHKLALRLSGAILGGLLGGICVVFILPYMSDIGQLSVLILGGSALGAWVSTSSDRLSYAGMQMAFAFFLTVLQGYAPSTDLTIPRDRIAGILLGNVAMSLVFSLLWPVSATDRVRSSIAEALRALARLLSSGAPGTRLAAMRALGAAHRFTGLALFELKALPERALQKHEVITLDSLDRIAAATFTIADQAASPAAAPADAAAAGWLATSADRVMNGGPVQPAPADAAADLERLLAVTPADDRIPLQARKLLLQQIALATDARS